MSVCVCVRVCVCVEFGHDVAASAFKIMFRLRRLRFSSNDDVILYCLRTVTSPEPSLRVRHNAARRLRKKRRQCYRKHVPSFLNRLLRGPWIDVQK